jgi:hypothetical protein
MFLILEVVSANKGNLGPASRAIFTTAGGSIGRRAGNDWILADRMSRDARAGTRWRRSSSNNDSARQRQQTGRTRAGAFQ